MGLELRPGVDTDEAVRSEACHASVLRISPTPAGHLEQAESERLVEALVSGAADGDPVRASFLAKGSGRQALVLALPSGHRQPIVHFDPHKQTHRPE